MIDARLHTLLMALLVCWLAGCTHTIPLLSASLECPIKPDDLATKCAAPATIASGATYQDLVQTALTDRKNLIECEKDREFLENSINECNVAIRKNNERIEEFNKKYAGRP